MKAQAQALGLPMPEVNTLSMALGTCSASPLQVAGAYAALAARGTATEPYMISLVKDEAGSTLYKHRRISRCAASRYAGADVLWRLWHCCCIQVGVATMSQRARLRLTLVLRAGSHVIS